MDFEWADMIHYAVVAAVVVSIVIVVTVVVKPWLGDEKDLESSAIMGALIALAIVFSGVIKDRRNPNTRRIANIERMVKALYDYYGLGGSPAGRAGGVGGDSGGSGGDGRGRSSTSSGGVSEGDPGTKGGESRNGG